MHQRAATSCAWVGWVGVPARGRGLELDDHHSPFQSKLFHDPMINASLTTKAAVDPSSQAWNDALAGRNTAGIKPTSRLAGRLHCLSSSSPRAYKRDLLLRTGIPEVQRKTMGVGRAGAELHPCVFLSCLKMHSQILSL